MYTNFIGVVSNVAGSLEIPQLGIGGYVAQGRLVVVHWRLYSVGCGTCGYDDKTDESLRLVRVK